MRSRTISSLPYIHLSSPRSMSGPITTPTSSIAAASMAKVPAGAYPAAIQAPPSVAAV